MQIKKIFPLVILCGSTFASAAPVYLTSPVDPSLAASSLIDFNAEAQGSFVSRSFGGGAVTIGTAGSALDIENSYLGGYGTSGNYFANAAGGNGFDIVFTDDVSAFGFNWGSANVAWTMQLFDASSILIGSFVVPAQSGAFAGFVGVDGNGLMIKSVNMVPSAYDYVLLDDLKFTPCGTSVPEPAPLALLGLGMLGFLGARRRK